MLRYPVKPSKDTNDTILVTPAGLLVCLTESTIGTAYPDVEK
jgi:hypothetical protein